MCQSQNVRFWGQAPSEAEEYLPPGDSIARLLQESLNERGWKTGELDIWRDCGWRLPCARQDAWLEFSLAEIEGGNQWILQIISLQHDHAGRAVAPAEPAAILALARDVHAVLSTGGDFSGFLWCWDDFPEEHNATQQPKPPTPY